MRARSTITPFASSSRLGPHKIENRIVNLNDHSATAAEMGSFAHENNCWRKILAREGIRTAVLRRNVPLSRPCLPAGLGVWAMANLTLRLFSNIARSPHHKLLALSLPISTSRIQEFKRCLKQMILAFRALALQNTICSHVQRVCCRSLSFSYCVLQPPKHKDYVYFSRTSGDYLVDLGHRCEVLFVHLS
jgi:hypothetical protein